MNVKVLFCGMGFWAESVRSSIFATKCDVELTNVPSHTDAAALLAATGRLDIAVFAVIDTLDLEQVVSTIKKLRTNQERAVVIGVGATTHYARLQNAGCHEIFLPEEVMNVATCIRMYARGARALNPA